MQVEVQEPVPGSGVKAPSSSPRAWAAICTAGKGECELTLPSGPVRPAARPAPRHSPATAFFPAPYAPPTQISSRAQSGGEPPVANRDQTLTFALRYTT